MSEPSGQIYKIFRMTSWTFRYGIADAYFEHMSTILTTNDIVPEMNTAAFYSKQLSLDYKVRNLFPRLLNKP